MAESPYKEVDVQLAGSLALRDDPHAIQPGDFRELVNCRFSRAGLVDKRFGFDPLTKDVASNIGSDVYSASGVASLEDELVLFGKYNQAVGTGPQVFSRDQQTDEWTPHGAAPHAMPTTQGVIHSPEAVYACDSIYANGYYFLVMETDYNSSGTVEVWGLSMDATTGDIVQGPSKLSAARAYAPRLAKADDGSVAVFWYEDSNKICGCPVLETTGRFDSAVTIVTNAQRNVNGITRPAFDCRGAINAAGTDTKFYLAYWGTSGGTGAIRVASLSAALATVTLGAIAFAVASGVMTIACQYDLDNNKFWVAFSYYDNIVTRMAYEIYAESAGSFITFLGLTVLYTPSASPERFTRASILWRDADNSLIWYSFDNATDASNTIKIYAHQADTSGNHTQTVNQLRASLLSDPFVYDGRCYYYGVIRDTGTRSHCQLFDAGITPYITPGTAPTANTGTPMSAHGIRLGGTASGSVLGAFASDPGYFNRVLNASFITSTKVFTACAVYKQVFAVGYTVSFAFDEFADSSTHKAIQFNKSLLFSPGGKYDGLRVHELGWLITPKAPDVTQTGGGSITGTVGVIVVWKTIDINGNVTRSAPSPVTLFNAASASTLTVVAAACNVTMRSHTRIEVYITEVNDIVFYLAGTQADVRSNGANYTETIVVSATAVTTNPIIYTQGQLGSIGGRLPNLGPGTLRALQVFKGRVFGIDDLGVIRYSNEPVDGEQAYWHDNLQLVISNTPATAIGPTESGLAAFSPVGTWQIFGDGPADDGSGETWSIQRVPTSVGCDEPNSVVQTGEGLFFSCQDAIYMLNRGMVVVFEGEGIGELVETYPNVISATHIPHSAEVRFELSDGTNGVCAVWDEQRSGWLSHERFDLSKAVGGAYWQGKYVWAVSGGTVYVENLDTFLDDGEYVEQRITLPYIKDRNLQSRARATHILPLGKWYSKHILKISFAYDYLDNWEEFQFSQEDMQRAEDGESPYQFELQLNNQKTESVGIRLETIAPVHGTLGDGHGATFSSVLFKMVQNEGAAGKLLPPEQRK